MKKIVLKVNEVFLSIQGEGQMAGHPCIFVRLFGCNFDCNWCDTQYARRGSDFETVSVTELVNEIRTYDPLSYICVTGGEPLLQRVGLADLISQLPEYYFEINTNGSSPIWESSNTRWVVDWKCPSSGMIDFNVSNIKKLTAKDDLMFVIRNKTDYNFAVARIPMIRELSEVKINFSPVWGVMAKKKLISWVLRDRLDVKVSIQIHKVVWGPTTRGV